MTLNITIRLVGPDSSDNDREERYKTATKLLDSITSIVHSIGAQVERTEIK